MTAPSTPSGGSAHIFDRALLARRRDRAAPAFDQHNFLVREVAARLADRLRDINRDFTSVLDLGCHCGELAAALPGPPETLVRTDLSAAMVARAGGLGVQADEEFLPFAEASFDLVVSCLSLHWVNDLPGTLIQINRCLKPDGLFLAALFGAGTLRELREAWLAAEMETQGGASPRVSPFAEVREAGGLLQRAGFALPVADTEAITVTYADAPALMADLRAMGESNTLAARRREPTRRGTLEAAAAAYRERFAEPDGRLPASFEILTLTGWHPHESQQKPLKPGSATARLADALGTAEIAAGEKTGPKRR